ncbi:YbfB/YjiJ family MFS transporter [Caenimonas terrae]|uniref:YbfB/YjiJ family MFS transporter n=1 Tax=Caenimonas terrae TaxID=696074 RepID=A0ABW0NEP5_9BURK
MKPWRIAAAGLVSLAVAMGIGRFAFTPLLPMMLADGVLDLPRASWLASANYLGYLVGALLCTFQPWIWRRLGRPPPPRPPLAVRAGLIATALLTLGMALQLPAAWPLLRFAAGVASAFVFVYTSGWCLSQLALRGVPEMGALIYTGPGGGIVLSGLAASGMVALRWPAADGWLIFGVLAAILTALVWPVFDARNELQPSTAAGPVVATAAAVAPRRDGIGLLTLAYGLAGFGYIITATFLPVIARQALPGSHWLDLFWPIFGLGVVLGALGASRVPSSANRLLMLAACYLIQAGGVAASLVSPTLAGFVIGSLLLGLPFTAITFFAMQEVRLLRPQQAASTMGLLTAMYGVGQIVGPPLAAAMLSRSSTPGVGFTRSLEIAGAALVLGALLYLWMARRHPAAPLPQ